MTMPPVHDPADDFVDPPEDDETVDDADPADPADPAEPPAADPAKKPAVLADPATGLKKALDAERAQHRKTAATLAALQAQGMSAQDKAWQDKVDATAAEGEATLKKVAARSALAQAGLQGSPSKLIALLDLGETVTVTADGELSGIDEQIEALKTEYPGLFQAAAPVTPAAPADGEPGANGNGATAPAGRVAIGSRRAPAKPPAGYAEQLARQIAGS
jgi:hypothetical protein